MFGINHSFHAVAVSSSSFSSFEKTLELMPKGKYNAKELISLEQPEATILPVTYYSAKQYFSNLFEPDPQKDIINKWGKDHYKYNLYLILCKTEKDSTLLISAPFKSLLMHIFKKMSNKATNLWLKYHVIDLNQFISNIIDQKRLEGKIKVSYLELEVEADAGLNITSYRGKNIITSDTFKKLRTSMAETGIKYNVRQCVVKYDGGGSNIFSLKCDKFGNFGYSVGNRLESIGRAGHIFHYFFDNNLIYHIEAFPPERLPKNQGTDYSTAEYLW